MKRTQVATHDIPGRFLIRGQMYPTSAPAPVGGAAYYVGAPTSLNLDGSGRGASDLNPKERGGYDPAFSRADAEGDCSCRM
jgi:hypothetical protein